MDEGRKGRRKDMRRRTEERLARGPITSTYDTEEEKEEEAEAAEEEASPPRLFSH